MNERLQMIVDYYPDQEFLSADGFEDAIIGVCGKKLVYSQAKCINILMERDGISEEDALEYFNFNVEDACVGERNPIWVDDLIFEEWGSEE